MPRLLTLVGPLLCLLPWSPPAAAAEPYTPGLPTACHVTVTQSVAGARVVLRAEVVANTGESVTGTVELAIDTGGATALRARAAGARETWSTTASYDGAPLEVRGPRLRPGQHVARLAFTPDGNLYGECADVVRFRVGAGGVTGGKAGRAGGFLPDTGGPHLGFLVLGLGLVAVGGVVVSRTRRAT